MNNASDFTPEQRAAHEAGHAILAYHFGALMDGISIVPEEAATIIDDSQLCPDDKTVLAVAGWSGEQIVFKDFQIDLAKVSIAPPKSWDAKMLQDALDELELIDVRERATRSHDAFVEAIEILRRQIKLFEKLQEVLLSQITLDANELSSWWIDNEGLWERD